MPINVPQGGQSPTSFPGHVTAQQAADYTKWINFYSRHFGVPAQILWNMAMQESTFRPDLLFVALAAILAVGALASASAEARPRLTLSQLPRVVADEIRDLKERGDCVPSRLDKAVHQRSLSGPRARDYIVDYAKIVCGEHRHQGYCGSGGCALTVVLNPRPGKWVRAKEPQDGVFNWRTIRRGGRTLLITTQTGWACGESPKWPACIVTHGESRGELVVISRVREK